MRVLDITPAPEQMEWLRPPAPVVGPSVRSAGVHVSDIIRDIDNALFNVGKRQKFDDLSPVEKARMGNYTSLGWAWEEMIRTAMKTMIPYTPVGEVKLDGIAGTPDGYNEGEHAVEEFKATWRSSRRPLDPDFWHWLAQIKAYCHMLQTETAFLRVFWVNGDYRDSGPWTQHLKLTFSKLEVQDNWEMLVNHAESKGWLKNGRQRKRT